MSRDFVTTIKVEQQQQQHQEQQQKRQEQERQPEEHLKLQPDQGRGKQALEEKQGQKGQGQKEQGEEEQSPVVGVKKPEREQLESQKQLRSGVSQLSEQTLQTEQAEQRQLKEQPRDQLPVEEWQQGVQRPTEKQLVKLQSQKKLVADQRNADQQSAETEKQAPAEKQQKAEQAPAEQQRKPELAPAEQQQKQPQLAAEQHREERHHTLGHRAAGQQRVRQRIVQEPKPTGEQHHSLLSGSAEEDSTATGITVIVAPVPVESVPHHGENCPQQEKQPPSSSISTAAAAQATADQDRRRQKREQFRGSNPELARARSGGSGGLGGQAAVRYGSSLAVDRLTTTGAGGVRTAPLPLAARHSSPTPASAREKELPGGKMKVKSPAAASGRADITAGGYAGGGHSDEQETIAELCRPAAGIGGSEGNGAATAEDLGALARITQDILEAMAQKPAQGGHYKELEDLLKVGRGFIGCLQPPPPPLGFSDLGIKLQVQY